MYQVNHKTQTFWVKVVYLVPNVQNLAEHAVGTIRLAPTILLTYEGVHINKQTRLGGLLTRCCCMTEQLNIKLRNFMLDNTQNMAMAALQQQQAFDTSQHLPQISFYQSNSTFVYLSRVRQYDT